MGKAFFITAGSRRSGSGWGGGKTGKTNKICMDEKFEGQFLAIHISLLQFPHSI